MKKLLLLLSLFTVSIINAQKANNFETKKPLKVNNCAIPTPGNLVINGDFEQFSSIPNSISQITYACGWASPTIGTPDYFHRDSESILVRIPEQVSSTQEVNPTHGGDAYAGFIFSGGAREIMRTQLSEPLEPNTEYILQFDVSVADHRTGNLLKSQAYLGSFIQLDVGGSLPIGNDPNGILLNNDVFNSNTECWDTITFTFTTGGTAGQEYLYLGTISNPELSSNGLGYNYIDNVVLKNSMDCELACNSNPSIIASQEQNCSYSFISLHEVNDCTGIPEFLWNFTNSTTTTSTEINPNVIPLNNGPLTVSLTITYDLSDGTQCIVSNSRTVNITCFPDEQCGTCSDTEGEFPIVSDDTFFDNDRILGKSITSDCSGNIYTIGFWDDTSISLRKYDLNGNLVWNQNPDIFDSDYIRNLIIEVDDNEEIYVKYNKTIKKYDNNGLLNWEIQIGGNPWGRNNSNFTLNKENGNLYLPIEQKTLFTNITTNSSVIIGVPDLPTNQSNVVKIDTNANITDLGAFPSSGILNLHYNNGLKLWSQNSANTGIEYRKYDSDTDLLETTNVNWISNLLISSFDSFTPLFYNNVNDEVYIYTGNITASNNNNTRVLSINNQGIVNTNVLLQTALYINQHKSGYQAPFSFNKNTGEMAIYADRTYNYGGSVILSTISSEGLLNTKFLTSPFLVSNSFYSRSFHAITYGGDCLYLYAHYGSENPITLNGGSILQSTGGINDNKSLVIRLQDDLEIKRPSAKKTTSKDLAKLVYNPIKNQTIQLKFNEKYKGYITFSLMDMSGNIVMESKGTLNKNQEFNLKIDKKGFDILFLKIVRDDGYSQIKRVVVN